MTVVTCGIIPVIDFITLLLDQSYKEEEEEEEEEEV